jgi:hypothetical protein
MHLCSTMQHIYEWCSQTLGNLSSLVSSSIRMIWLFDHSRNVRKVYNFQFYTFTPYIHRANKLQFLLLHSWLQVLRKRFTSRKKHKNILIQPITEDAQRIVSKSNCSLHVPAFLLVGFLVSLRNFEQNCFWL